MEIYLPESPETVREKLENHLTDGVGCCKIESSDARNVSRSLRKSILQKIDPEISSDTPIILTGHQPIFYPPGILIKELLAFAIAKSSKGAAFNLTVDSDESLISFDYPEADVSEEAAYRILKKNRVLLNRTGSVLFKQNLLSEKKKILLNEIKHCSRNVPEIFSENDSKRILDELSILSSIVDSSVEVQEPGIALKENWERRHGISVYNIFVSDLASSDAFRYFVEIILERGDEFRTIYNRAIEDYRQAHHIKNPAQPIPNLHVNEKELPFWILKDGHRLPFFETEKISGSIVLPRAITLTLFCRLFLSDLMIHGRGGARYEIITNRVLKEFFCCSGSPFTVASATLALDGRSEFPVDSRDIREINRDIRAIQFDPGKFLDPMHPVYIEKMHLIKELESQDKTKNKNVIHAQIMKLNQQMQSELNDFSKKLIIEKRYAKIVQKNRDVLWDRTFPFIFYRLEPLLSAVESFFHSTS